MIMQIVVYVCFCAAMCLQVWCPLVLWWQGVHVFGDLRATGKGSIAWFDLNCPASELGSWRKTNFA